MRPVKGEFGTRTHIARSGNSLALRIPRRVAEELGVDEGGDVELTLEPGRLVVRPGPPRLQVLLAGVTDQNLPESFDDAPRGEETL